MRILITGSSGLVGTALQVHLREAGHEVLILQRGATSPGKPTWDPTGGEIHLAAVGKLDAVFHLAGAGISQGRWNTSKKAAILDSRVFGTDLLAKALIASQTPPKLIVTASAIGIYGDRGNEALTEHSALGSGFLADVCRQWELASQPAADVGIRLVQARIGVILDTAGGALKQMLPPFRLGLGGVIGNGQQWMSWISLADVVAIFEFFLHAEHLAGPINLTAPNPVSNREFTKALGQVLHRPTILPLPAFLVSLLLGEMGRELLLGGAKVLPQKLLEAGFQFRHVVLRELLHELSAPNS